MKNNRKSYKKRRQTRVNLRSARKLLCVMVIMVLIFGVAWPNGTMATMPAYASNAAGEEQGSEESTTSEEDTTTAAAEDYSEESASDEESSEEDIPAEEEASTEGDVPAEEEASTEEDVPAEEEASTEEDIPTEEEASTEADIPTEEEASTEGESSTDASDETTEEKGTEDTGTTEGASNPNSVKDTYLNELDTLMDQAESLDAEADNLWNECYTIYTETMETYDDAYTLWEQGGMSDSEFEEIELAAQAVIGYLTGTYGFDPYAPATLEEEDIQTTALESGFENAISVSIRQGENAEEQFAKGDFVKNIVISVYDDNGTVIENSGIRYSSGGKGGKSYYLSADENSTPGTYFVKVTYTGNNEIQQTLYYEVTVTEKESSDDNSSNELDPTKYNKDSYVFYDTMTPTYNNDGTVKSGTVATADRMKVSTVKLNNTSVVQGDSSSTSWSTTGATQLSTYFPNAANTNSSTMQSGTLVITPASGYYVTAVVVACASRTNVNGTTVSGSTPYNCNTWSEGNAFTTSFSVGTGGAVTVDLSSLDFSHRSQSNAYFVLVSVAPVPSPLYVEYNYGEIVTYLTKTGYQSDSDYIKTFNSPAEWTVTSTSANAYGTGGIQTNYTQYKYAYTTSSTEAANWKHYANTVTSTAKEAAAMAGYYFDGWKAEYYTKCTTSETDDSYGNNYTYTFSGSYGNSTYQENANVSLTTNVKLIAQWKPIKLSITKTVAGLSSNITGTYKVQLYKDGETYGDSHEFSVVGSNTSEAWEISPVTPGKYTIVETEPTVGQVVNDNDTNKYLVSTVYSQDVVITADEIVNGTCRTNTLNVTNTYSDAEPALKVVKVWQDVNGNTLNEIATANMPSVTFNIECTAHRYEKQVTLTYDSSDTSNYGWVKKLSGTALALPDGCSVGDLVVTEVVPNGYTQVGETVVTTEEDTTNKLIYSVHTITNKLDTTSVTVTKTVTGNMGDWNKDFSFSMVLTGGTLTTGDYDDYTVSADGKTITFTLKHNDSVTISNIPLNATLTLTESDVSAYRVTVNNKVIKEQDNAASSATTENITVSSGMTISVVNHNEAIIDTGIGLTSLPFILLMSAVMLLGFIFMIGKCSIREI